MVEQLQGPFEKFGGLVAVCCCYSSLCITAAHCCQSKNFSNDPCSCSTILKRVLKWL